MNHSTLFLTSRGERHQQSAFAAAPPELAITVLRDPPRAEVLRRLPDAEFLISERAGTLDAELIAAGRNLKLIQRLGTQTWDIDLAAARRAGVPVCYLPIRGCALVAEHLVMQLLVLAKRARELMQIVADAGNWGEPRRCDENYFAYNWSRRENIRGIAGSVVGIFGFGEIGAELARRLRGFDCEILYTKRKRLPQSAERELALSFASRDELLRRSDFVCSLLPLLPETAQTLNAAAFALMKRGAIFAHCGAGAVVDENALIIALQSGHLAGAALDTYTHEPMRANDPLLALAHDPMRNVMLTPHIAAGSPQADRHRRAEDYANIVAWLAGQPLRYRLV